MPDETVHYGAVPTRNPDPKRADDLGECAEFHYIVRGAYVALVDRDGTLILDADREPVRHRLVEGEDPRQMAARLALREHRRQQDQPRGFSGPLRYPPRSSIV